MKIVSTTLSNSCETIIGDALKSIEPYVDQCILIDTGIMDYTIEYAGDVVGKKLKVYKYRWRNDFADARNFALKMAQIEGADYAITLDTDEKIKAQQDLRSFIEAQPESDVFLMYSHKGDYAKDRIFKLPLKKRARWVGQTHEYFDGLSRKSEIHIPPDVAVFWEKAKTQEQTHHKLNRDVEILTQYVKKHPDARWYFYLGESFRNLEEYQKAIEAYEQCLKMSVWDEEKGWCYYCIAICHSKLERYEHAVHSCMRGLVEHAGMAELLWLAGWCRYQQGNYKNAVYFAELAKVLNKNSQLYKTFPRIGFRHIDAYDILPDNLAKCAWEKLGYDICDR